MKVLEVFDKVPPAVESFFSKTFVLTAGKAVMEIMIIFYVFVSAQITKSIRRFGVGALPLAPRPGRLQGGRIRRAYWAWGGVVGTVHRTSGGDAVMARACH